MKNVLIVLFVVIFQSNPVCAQSTTDVSFEFQAYPTGLIPGFRIEKSLSAKSTLHLRLAYQFIDHRDLGVHQNEEGSGFGFTLGFNKFLKHYYEKWHFGIRNDIWFNTIDWESSIGTAPVPFGTTDIIVVQPTAQIGYLFDFNKSWFITPTVSFGYEVNVRTEGEPTGEGAILLIGINVGKRWMKIGRPSSNPDL